MFYLEFFDDESWIEVELKWWEQVEVNKECQGETEAGVHPSHRRHLQVGLPKHVRQRHLQEERLQKTGCQILSQNFCSELNNIFVHWNSKQGHFDIFGN